MVTDGRLALPQLLAERLHVQFFLSIQVEENAEPGLVGEEFEDPEELVFQFGRRLR